MAYLTNKQYQCCQQKQIIFFFALQMSWNFNTVTMPLALVKIKTNHSIDIKKKTLKAEK